ncbi:hypothetical protein J2X69_001823 [Algoriphagus sp. 4150]|uniref:hypothetical protein n=1 Tax=Algoriphagus sp. 4150 TaxID=2817756 RepID=UPI0028668BDC|nr:hypothetical protein [Algoriphagus sp. 4150]MDR7129486.1 hypothetical protein [Algoriphagus sp. 4150]
MKTLLRIYLVLIFAGSALDAGSENDSINSGFPVEASNFAINSGYSQNQKEMANCMQLPLSVEYKKINTVGKEKISN